MNTDNALPVDGFSSTGNIFLSNPMKYCLCRGSLIEVIFMAVGKSAKNRYFCPFCCREGAKR
nr:MAG TPA: large ribosomal subunit 50S, antibiotic, chloramphenicol, LSU, RIBOSOME [Caudoviricetes sp.]